MVLGSLLVPGTSAWAQDGSPRPAAERLAVARSDPAGGTEIVLLDLDGSNAQTVFHHPGPAVIDNLGWSPDGTQLAFDLGVVISVRDDGPASPDPYPDRRWEVHLLDLSDGTDARLHIDLPHDGDPTWLGDGTLVTHTWPAGADYGPRELHHWTGDGEPAAPIPVPDGRLVPLIAPSPDGMRFAAAAMAAADFEDVRLLVYDVPTLAWTVLDDEGGSIPEWSPDGRWITQEQSGSDEDRIVVIDTLEQTRRDVTRPGEMPVPCDRECSVPWPDAWSADGTRIIVSASSDRVAMLLSIDADGERIRPFRFRSGDSLRLRQWPEGRDLERVPGPPGGPVVLADLDGNVLHVADDGRSATWLTDHFADGTRPLAVLPDGSGLLVTRNGSVAIMALDDGRILDTLITEGPELIDAVAFRGILGPGT